MEITELIKQFVDDRIEFNPGHATVSTDAVAALNPWLSERGFTQISYAYRNPFTPRLLVPYLSRELLTRGYAYRQFRPQPGELFASRVAPPAGPYRGWRGVRLTN